MAPRQGPEMLMIAAASAALLARWRRYAMRRSERKRMHRRTQCGQWQWHARKRKQTMRRKQRQQDVSARVCISI